MRTGMWWVRLACVAVGLPVVAISAWYGAIFMLFPPVQAIVTGLALLPVELVLRLTARVVERTRWALLAVVPLAGATFISAGVFVFFGVLSASHLKARGVWGFLKHLTRDWATIIEAFFPVFAGAVLVLALVTAGALCIGARARRLYRVAG